MASLTTIPNVTWTAATDAVGIAGYRVLVAPSDRPWDLEQVASVGGGTLIATATGLRPGTDYLLHVEAVDAAGNVDASPATRSFTVDAGTPPLKTARIGRPSVGGPDKVAEVAALANQHNTPMRIGVNSGSLPKHLHALERENSVEALVTAATEFVALMESLDFTNFKVSIKSTNVPNTIAANRLLSDRIPYPLHLGITEAGTKWSGSLKSAVGLGTLLADDIGDTIRISLSTFHAEEEVKVAWEILKALQLRERGPVLIACPTCGRLQFDMDAVTQEVEQRLEAYDEAIEVAVLGCAVNGIGEAKHADFGIAGAKNEGVVFAHGKAIRKVPTEQLVDELFAQIDKSFKSGGEVDFDEKESAEGEAWVKKIEEENADDLTPEKIAAMEHEASQKAENDKLLEEVSPTAGRRFTRA